jgi:diguanylate cyclase (GGDEF)-like protein
LISDIEAGNYPETLCFSSTCFQFSHAFPLLDGSQQIGALLLCSRSSEINEGLDEIAPCISIIAKKLISENKRVTPAREMSYKKILDSLPFMVSHLDKNHRFLFANQRYADYFYTDGDKFLGLKLEDIVDLSSIPEYQTALEQVEAGNSYQFDRKIYVDHQQRILQTRLIPEGNNGGFFVVSQDVTELRSSYHQLEHQANHDSLTGLPNRNTLTSQIKEQIGCKYLYSALLFIDLDDLKSTNDKYGHQYGDEILLKFAELLKQTLRAQDLPFRYAGDEFIALLTRLSEPEPVVQKLCEDLVASLPLVINVSGREVECRCSVGAVIMDPNSDVTADEWIHCADNAMYEAKTQGKGRYVIHNPLAGES